VNYAISIAFLKDEDKISATDYFALYTQKIKEWNAQPTLRKTKWKDNWTYAIGR